MLAMFHVLLNLRVAIVGPGSPICLHVGPWPDCGLYPRVGADPELAPGHRIILNRLLGKRPKQARELT
jgi:hypothetical protein